MKYSILMDTDSYKLGHNAPQNKNACGMYPPNTTYMQSYFESRGGEFNECTLFGLQYLLEEYLTKQVTKKQVLEAESFALAHGEPFNKKGWMHVVEKHDGKLPVRIRAIPEGTVVPVSNAIMTVESTDPEVFWLVSWIETMLVRLWYPSTIAITSRESKKILKMYLDMTADDPEAAIPFALHDFGARGCSSLEQSRLGGAAHLLSFMGSDTIEGIRFANHYYDCEMAGNSIPATEHSTMTMWGKENEFKAYENYVKEYLTNRTVPEGMPKLAACVSDSYDIYNAVENGWCESLLPLVKESGGTLVIRPDSGDPETVLCKMFEILEKKIGMEKNTKGYKMLPPYFRVIQGDGIDRESMEQILKTLTDRGISASNIAFGSGGGLLQKVNRDTQKWAFKCCSAIVDGKQVDVRKTPVTDEGKLSKAGKLDLIKMEDGQYKTVVITQDCAAHDRSVMNMVYENGEIKYHTTFDECRKRMEL